MNHILSCKSSVVGTGAEAVHLFILIQQIQRTAMKAPRKTRQAMVSTATSTLPRPSAASAWHRVTSCPCCLPVPGTPP